MVEPGTDACSHEDLLPEIANNRTRQVVYSFALVVCIAILLGHVVALVLTVLRHRLAIRRRWTRLTQSFPRSCRDVLLAFKGCCPSWWPGKSAQDKEHSMINALATQIRIERSRLGIRMISYVLLPFVALHTVQLIRALWLDGEGDHFPDQGELNGVTPYVYHPELCPVLVVATCFIFLTIFPKGVKPVVLNIMNVGFTAFWLWKYAMLRHSDYVHNTAWIAACRILLGFILGDAVVTGILHTIVTAADIVIYTADVEACGEGQRAYRAIQTFIFVAASIIGWILDRTTMSEAKARFQALRSTRTEIQVRRLLSGMCDCIVELGPDLSLLRPAPKLACMLLMQPSGMALLGRPFLDFVPEGDRCRVSDFIAADLVPDELLSVTDSCEGQGPAEAEPALSLHLHLSDAYQSQVAVQLFHASFYDLMGRVCHLIGLNEVGDLTCQSRRERARALSLDLGVRSTDDAVSHHATTLFSESTLLADDSASMVAARVPTEAEDYKGSDHETTSPCSPSRKAQLERERQMAVDRWHSEKLSQAPAAADICFDGLRFSILQQGSRVPVIDANLLEKTTLQQWVADWSSTRAWVQDFTNAALRPVTATSWPGHAELPSKVSFKVSFRATCPLPTDILTRPAADPGADHAGDPRRVGGQPGPPMKLPLSSLRLTAANRRGSSSGSDHGRRRRAAANWQLGTSPGLASQARVQRALSAQERVISAQALPLGVPGEPKKMDKAASLGGIRTGALRIAL